MISKAKNTKGWYDAIKKVINDKEYRDYLSKNLYDFVKEKYTLEIVTADRMKWYEEVVNKKRMNKQLLDSLVSN